MNWKAQLKQTQRALGLGLFSHRFEITIFNVCEEMKQQIGNFFQGTSNNENNTMKNSKAENTIPDSKTKWAGMTTNSSQQERKLIKWEIDQEKIYRIKQR